MSRVWWYDINFERFGPVEAEELKCLFIAGRVQAGTPVWRPGMTDWAFLGGVEELLPDWQKNDPAPPVSERSDETSETKASATRRDKGRASLVEDSVSSRPFPEPHGFRRGQRKESDREALDRLAPLPTPSRFQQSSPGPSPTPQLALEASPEALPVPQFQTLAPAGPWRRFLARMVDTTLESLLVGFGLAYFLAPRFPAFALWLDKPESAVGFAILVLPLSLVLDAVIAEVGGNTPGKALLGVSVSSDKETQLSSTEYLARNLRVWWFGMAAGLPFFCLLSFGWQTARLLRNGSTGYDHGRYVVHAAPIGWARQALAICIVVGMMLGAKLIEILESKSAVRQPVAAMQTNEVQLERPQEVTPSFSYEQAVTPAAVSTASRKVTDGRGGARGNTDMPIAEGRSVQNDCAARRLSGLPADGCPRTGNETRACEFKGVMTDADYAACGLTPPGSR